MPGSGCYSVCTSLQIYAADQTGAQNAVQVGPNHVRCRNYPCLVWFQTNCPLTDVGIRGEVDGTRYSFPTWQTTNANGAVVWTYERPTSEQAYTNYTNVVVFATGHPTPDSEAQGTATIELAP
jgi:hypothetical protein